MTNPSIPEHVFISYSHADEEFVKKIAADLEKAGISIWIDRTGLTPGTPNWNKAVRDAISRSFAVLLIASPDSGQSNFVQGELSIAESYECPVYPVWIAGKWVDCVPLGMIQAQYIDCCNADYEAGLSQLIEMLKKVIEDRTPKHFLLTDEDRFRLPKGYLSIKLDEQKTVAMRPGSYQSLYFLLTDLYLGYLSDLYRPFTYGSEWILASDADSRVSLLVAPWSWLLAANRKHSLSISDPIWAASLPKTHGLEAGTCWQIIDRSPVSAFGIATNNPLMAQVLDDLKLSLSLVDLLDAVVVKQDGCYEDEKTYAKLVSPEAVSSDDYRLLFVCTCPRFSHSEKAFVVERWEMLEAMSQWYRPQRSS